MSPRNDSDEMQLEPYYHHVDCITRQIACPCKPVYSIVTHAPTEEVK